MSDYDDAALEQLILSQGANAAGTAFGLPPGVGSMITGALGFLGQKDTNSANAALAQKQMDFQERMSSTAHQREVADLIAAGLNPMLTGKYGGSSTPPGAMAVMQNPSESGSRSASSAIALENLHNQNDLLKAQAEQARSAAGKSDSETALNKALIPGEDGLIKGPGSLPGANINAQTEMFGALSRHAGAQIQELGSRIGLQQKEIDALKARIPGMIAESKISTHNITTAKNKDAAMDTWVGRNIIPYIQSIVGGSSAYRNVTR